MKGYRNPIILIWQTMNFNAMMSGGQYGDAMEVMEVIQYSTYRPVSDTYCIVTTDGLDFMLVARDGKIVDVIEIPFETGE